MVGYLLKIAEGFLCFPANFPFFHSLLRRSVSLLLWGYGLGKMWRIKGKEELVYEMISLDGATRYPVSYAFDGMGWNFDPPGQVGLIVILTL